MLVIFKAESSRGDDPSPSSCRRRSSLSTGLAGTGPAASNRSPFAAHQTGLTNPPEALGPPASAPDISSHAASPIRPTLAGAPRQPRSGHICRLVHADFDPADDPSDGGAARGTRLARQSQPGQHSLFRGRNLWPCRPSVHPAADASAAPAL